ncbi:lysostaphin resistance A-like protein [Falsibacillus pallidus]|uniref:CPBP family intramembrane glutamic endopeptidase n=1 Tax=Falsibacillus pallidus TaxID=493781 RepID=UPI003D983050
MERFRQSEIIKQLTAKQLIQQVYYTQLALLTISFFLGIFLFDRFSSFADLWKFDLRLIVFGVLNGVAVVLLDVIMMKILPDRFYDDGGINKKIFSNLTGGGIFLISLAIAFCEEILFRGLVQTHTNWWIAGIIFAAIHIRYWGHWYLIVNIFLLSFWISGIYELTGHSITAVISMHFTIDFLLGLVIRKKAKNEQKEGMSNEN